MKDMIIFITSCIFTIFVCYKLIPNMNPYNFPKYEDIDKYTYLDDAGVYYKYKRIYL